MTYPGTGILLCGSLTWEKSSPGWDRYRVVELLLLLVGWGHQQKGGSKTPQATRYTPDCYHYIHATTRTTTTAAIITFMLQLEVLLLLLSLHSRCYIKKLLPLWYGHLWWAGNRKMSFDYVREGNTLLMIAW